MIRRILYVQHYSGLGGSPLSLLYLIEQLDRARYDPSVLFIGGEGNAVTQFRKRGISTFVRSDISIFPHALGAWLPLRSLRPWQLWRRLVQILPSARRVRDFVIEHPADLVHINSLVQVPTGLGVKWSGVPAVWHIRESLHPGYLGIRRWLVRKCLGWCAEAIIAISACNAAQLKLASKVRVVYNFVNFMQFDRHLIGKSFRQSIGVASDCPLVLMLGGIVHSKGADIFVEAAALVRKARSDVLFLIAGEPPQGQSSSWLRRRLRRLVERLASLPNVERRALELIRLHHLQDTVKFVGMRLDVPEMLAASAILVWPATVSHFARPIIEAGAMARPVVASDFPSSRELVRDHETGLLVPPADPYELAQSILYLLDHPAEAQRLGEVGYALARERYDAKTNVQAICDVYESVLARRVTGIESQ